VHEAIEDRVSEGWLVDDVMPCLDWQLAGDQRRSRADSPNLCELFPGKPKGLHWRTYERLQRIHDAAESRLP
jgi:hypothetical protein